MGKSNKYIINLIEIFLILVIPFAVIGFSVLDKLDVFKQISGLTSAEKTSNYSLATQWSGAEETFIYRNNSDFDPTWKLIKKNYNSELPNNKPTFLTRFAIKNASYTNLPDDDEKGSRKIILVPGGTPIAVGFCLSGKISECDVSIVGTVDDLRSWVIQEEESYRFKFNLLITLISILLGLYLHKFESARDPSL